MEYSLQYRTQIPARGAVPLLLSLVRSLLYLCYSLSYGLYFILCKVSFIRGKKPGPLVKHLIVTVCVIIKVDLFHIGYQ